ncbi:serine/threonine protein kinase CDC15 KNAG_0K01240 [Huiozyma naganishii CBS 8797]|uniref:non-specific serine/threonine protein kinase n=1 Tax=Huiozyma naganishii (strain ATCC MYA-139 / BCRC 22969 / CBS 8797 / KCTC 17520 / NBRC 10181 / NCYC 3082 / Yp74L-3) TaxID=1071383 RepID=J7SA79_HUIN7|nr:hypothetical protein KNAG_0K01240 [Kazachstania naganishii CBS 8797]CCK72489.1 hypothetical protein KNAG_0K01240 [Kazachstania naganishii CBS 8797]
MEPMAATAVQGGSTGPHQERTTNGKGNSTKYQLNQVIGKGSYGIVYKAVNKSTKQVVAIKEINYTSDEELNEIMIEIDLLKNLHHINIVKYHGFIQKMSNLYIILEYAAHGSLKGLLSSRIGHLLDEAETKIYVRQTLDGLAYLHEQGVIHRDIKAANLLLDSTNTVKLADFGVSTKVNNTAKTLAGSLNWMAPEIVTNKGASTLSDIWSLGATIVELMTGKPPFHNLLDINIYYAMENDNECYYPPASLPEGAKQFLALCFQKNMFKRPTAKSLLKHSWLFDENVRREKETTKLAKFEEVFQEDGFNWDDDFRENDIPLSRLLTNSPRKINANIAGGSPLKKTPFKRINNQAGPDTAYTKGPAYHKTDDYDNNENMEIDDSLLYDGNYYLEKFVNDKSLQIPTEKYSMIIRDCKTNDIVISIFSVLQDLNFAITTGQIDFLCRLFNLDQRENDSRIINCFIEFGGVSLIMHSPSLVWELINTQNRQEILKTLYQSGVMNKGNIKLLETNSMLYFELVYKFLDFTSMKFWYQWCSKNLNIELLVKRMYQENNRRVQSILLKLSSFDADLGNGGCHWVLESILPVLTANQVRTKIPQIHYIVFKSIAYMLQNSHKESLFFGKDSTNSIKGNKGSEFFKNSRVNLLLRTSSNLNTTSPYDTVSMTPAANSPLKQYPRNSTSTGRPRFRSFPMELNNGLDAAEEEISSIKLPNNFGPWLLSIVNYNNDVIFDCNSNIHFWKYLIKVCHLASRLDEEILVSLNRSDRFKALSLHILETYGSPSVNSQQDHRNLKSIIRTILLIIIDITKAGQNDHSFNFAEFVTKVLRDHKEFGPECMDIAINCYQSEEKFVTPAATLSRLFYEFDANDANFTSFVSKFVKLCTVERTVPEHIAMQRDFPKRIQLFFELYGNSLLIQIELLKLVKAILSQGNPPRDTVVRIVTFLQTNWDDDPIAGDKGSSVQQVGRGSVLIMQLCKDVEGLLV